MFESVKRLRSELDLYRLDMDNRSCSNGCRLSDFSTSGTVGNGDGTRVSVRSSSGSFSADVVVLSAAFFGDRADFLFCTFNA